MAQDQIAAIGNLIQAMGLDQSKVMGPLREKFRRNAWTMLESLNRRQQEIMKLIYGFGSDESYTETEVSTIFKTTPIKLQNELQAIIEKLRSTHASKLLQ